MAVKRYKLTRQLRRGMSVIKQDSIIEVEEGSQPVGAVEVAEDAPLHDWTQAPVENEAPVEDEN